MNTETAHKPVPPWAWWGLLAAVFSFIALISALVAWAAALSEDTIARRSMMIPNAILEVSGGAIDSAIDGILAVQHTTPETNPAEQTHTPDGLPPVEQAAIPPLQNPENQPATTPAQNKILPPAPQTAQQTATPQPAEDPILSGLPWKANAAKYNRSETRPRIAVIVTGLGLRAKETEFALAELPQLITVAFSAYGSNLFALIEKVRGKNQEALLELPLEPVYYPGSDPGPRALFTTKSWDDNYKNLDWIINQGKGSVGVVAFMGSKFLSNTAQMKQLLMELKKRGYVFVDNMSAVNSATADLSESLKSQTATVTLLIDNEPSRAAIESRLLELEQQARTTGYAIGLAHAYPVSIAKIKEWAASLESKGIALVPITALVDAGK